MQPSPDDEIPDEALLQLLDQVEGTLDARAAAQTAQSAAAANNAPSPAGPSLADVMAAGARRMQQIREREAALDELKAKYKGTRGRYNLSDTQRKRKLDAELVLLKAGKNIADVQAPARAPEPAVLEAARNSDVISQRLAHPQQPPNGR